MELRFYTADVFTDKPFHGAQIAVFPHAEGVDDTRMQLIARELNLSHTVFVFSAGSDPYRRRVRIFSPLSEIGFAGHPLIAAAYVLASIGEITLERKYTAMVLEQNCGPIDVYIVQDQGRPVLVQFTMQARATIDRFVPAHHELAGILSIETSDIRTHKYTSLLASCGYPYLIVPLRSYGAVRNARFNFSAWSQSAAPATLVREILLFSTHAESASNFHGRLVGPQIGVNEDPPIASSLPAFAGYLCAHEHIKQGIYTFTIERGETKTRQSVLTVEMDNRNTGELTLRVGGPAVMVSEGKMHLAA